MDVTDVPWAFLDPLFGRGRREAAIRAKLSMQEILLQNKLQQLQQRQLQPHSTSFGLPRLQSQ